MKRSSNPATTTRKTKRAPRKNHKVKLTRARIRRRLNTPPPVDRITHTVPTDDNHDVHLKIIQLRANTLCTQKQHKPDRRSCEPLAHHQHQPKNLDKINDINVQNTPGIYDRSLTKRECSKVFKSHAQGAEAWSMSNPVDGAIVALAVTRPHEGSVLEIVMLCGSPGGWAHKLHERIKEDAQQRRFRYLVLSALNWTVAQLYHTKFGYEFDKKGQFKEAHGGVFYELNERGHADPTGKHWAVPSMGMYKRL